jgi:hypothetical protein
VTANAAKYAPRNSQSHPLKGQVCQLVQADIRTFEPSHEHLLQALHYDAIITDPLYGCKHLKLYSELREFAARYRVSGAVCAVMMGQAYLGDVTDCLSENLLCKDMRLFRTRGVYSGMGPASRMDLEADGST